MARRAAKKDSIVFFISQAAFRKWLERNHARASELHVGLRKTSSKKPGLDYQQALEEALCFGWIDGVRRRLDAERWTIRFTPRKKGTVWSAVNVRKALELDKRGLLAPPGLAAFRARKPSRRKPATGG